MEDNVKTAGYLLRLLAKGIDINILFIPFFIVIKYYSVVKTTYAFLNTTMVLLVVILLAVYIGILYNTYLTSRFGGTIGKLIVGLRVVDEKGEFLTDRRAFFRCTVGYFVSGLFFGLGYFWIIKDNKNQGWHDQISETYVVQRGVSAMSVMLGIVSVFAFIIFYSLSFYSLYQDMSKNFEYIVTDFRLQINNIMYQIKDLDNSQDSSIKL